MEGKSEWIVKIVAMCPHCVTKNVKLNCNGFQTVEPIDPSILRDLGYDCLVNDGKPIYGEALSFKYAWKEPFPLVPVSADIYCS